MIPLQISRLQLAAKARREGYLAAVMALSTPDPAHAGFVLLAEKDYEAVGGAFAIVPKPAPAKAPRLRLGDVIAAVATPVARALRLDCVDPASGRLRPESGCARRRAALNRITL